MTRLLSKDRNTIDVTIAPHPFAADREHHRLDAGGTIADVVARLQPDEVLRRHAHVYRGGEYVPQEKWGATATRPGDSLSIRMVPMGGGGGGGKNPLRTVLSLAVMVATSGLSSTFSGLTMFGLNVGRGLSLGINLLGKLALNALAPPPKARFGATVKESPTLFIQGARNNATPFARVPKVLGKHRMVPPLGALPYTETVGNDQYMRMLFVWGYGPLQISDLKIGETPLSDFKDVQVETRLGYPGDAPITLYTNSVLQNDLQVSLTAAAGYVTRTTELDAEEISVDITLPRGLQKFDSKGNKQATTVSIEIQYSPKGLNQWSAGAGSYKAIDAQNVTGITRPAAYIYRDISYRVTRIDRVVLDPASGDASLVQGTPFRQGIDAGVPQPPALPAGQLAIARIERNSDDTAIISSGKITDERDLGLVGKVYEASGNFLASGGSSDAVSLAAGGLKLSAIEITGKQSAALRKSYSFRVPKGQYDVRVKRLTADATDDNTFDETHWTALRTIRYAKPVNMTGLAMTALRIKATDQLNGVIDRFNGVVHSILPDWNGSAWAEQVTSNPAAIFRHVLQSSANARPLADGRIDLAKLQSWHNTCADEGREFNAVIDYDVSVREVLQDVAAVGRASPTLIDGKWAVVEDKAQTVPVQHFTPRNTFGFKGEKAFDDNPEALRVRFINSDNGWLQDERQVFVDGYTPDTATKYEALELVGVTRADQAWKDGRYHLAVARLRPETYSFFTDVEHIVCTRGDLIRFTHDVTLHGLGSARVGSVAISGGNVTGITVDSAFVMEAEADKHYSVRFRKAEGSTLLKEVVTVPGQTQTLQFKTPFDEGDAPAPGDLVMFGETGSESVELLVKSIEPQNDLTARITCVDYSPAIYMADTGVIPPFSSQITVPPDLKRPPAPVLSGIQSDDSVLIRGADGAPLPSIVVTLAPPEFPLPLSIAAQIRDTEESDFFAAKFVAGENQLTITGVESGKSYDIRIFYRNLAGMSSPELLVLNHHVIGDTGVPGDVDNFSINTLGGTAHLSWDAVSDLDLSHYRIKFSNATSGVTWATAADLVVRVAKPATTASVPAALGTYLIKAVDLGGRESANETLIVSTVAATSGFGSINHIEEEPEWSGADPEGVEVVDDTLRLIIDNATHTFETYGVYDFDNYINLGAIHTVTLTAEMEAIGANLVESIDDWSNIDLVESWDNTVDPSEWGVKVQVAQTDDDPAGTPTWSAFRDFVIGEYSARAFSFRAILTSNQAGVTPIISLLNVAAHMRTSTRSDNNLTSASTDTPTVVTYASAFHTFSALTITAQSMATGDYYTITNPTHEGFEIIFKDSSGARITRTFDYIATGYGY